MYSAHVSRSTMLCLRPVMTVTTAFMSNPLIDRLPSSPRCQTPHQHGHHPATGQSHTTHPCPWCLGVPGDVVKVMWMCSGCPRPPKHKQRWIIKSESSFTGNRLSPVRSLSGILHQTVDQGLLTQAGRDTAPLHNRPVISTGLCGLHFFHPVQIITRKDN